MIINNKEFNSGTHVMAILNLTPDSFFDSSRVTQSNILKRAEKALLDGAEVLDIGAQSTRPGHVEIDATEEIKRLREPIAALRHEFPTTPISIDTYYEEVANVCLNEGADLINDIWGLQHDKNMAKIIAKFNASVCIMHNQNGTEYKDMWQDIFNFLNNSLILAKNENIDSNKIVIDGGIGFGKTREQNYEVLNNYEKLHELNYPLLLGTSRKSLFGGNVIDRLPQTLESTKLAVRKNVLFVRVHDVKENVETIKETLDEIQHNN